MFSQYLVPVFDFEFTGKIKESIDKGMNDDLLTKE